MLYYGRPFLIYLYQYYGGRLKQALASGFDHQDHQYFWLYNELLLRVNCLRKTMLELDALPSYMAIGKEEDAFRFAQGMSSSCFSQQALEDAPKSEDGSCVYFSDSCQYWAGVLEALGSFEGDYDYKNLPCFYVDLVEYIIRMLQLHFFVREQLHRPIDRNKFDELMRWKPDLGLTA